MFAFQRTLQTPATPVDTGRKLNVHKTFRRRPGRLLSVLRPYNLRPMSTGTGCRSAFRTL